MTDLPAWLLVVLLVLAAYRGTRLATRDELPLIKTPRDAAANWLDPRDEHGQRTPAAPLGGLGRAIAYLIECDWCTSVWVAGLVTLGTDLVASVPLPWLMWWAVAGAAGLLCAAEQRLGQLSQLTELQMADLRRDLRRRGATGV